MEIGYLIASLVFTSACPTILMTDFPQYHNTHLQTIYLNVYLHVTFVSEYKINDFYRYYFGRIELFCGIISMEYLLAVMSSNELLIS